MNQFRTMIVLGSVAMLGALGGCSAVDAAPAETLGETQAALSSDACPAGVPALLTPPPGETLKSKLSAVGVQIYMCNALKNGAGFAWTFVAPQANLFNDDGSMVGTHFIGPTWQGNDGSSVVGKKAQGVTVDPSAVPWLLLSAVSHSSAAGRFEDVTSIQRLSTVGGNAPADVCDAATVGTLVQVPYSADYFFYRAKPSGNVNQCPAN